MVYRTHVSFNKSTDFLNYFLTIINYLNMPCDILKNLLIC